MEHDHPENPQNGDATNPAPDVKKSEGARLFATQLSKFFNHEIPQRFALRKWDAPLICIVATLVLAWVLIFGYYRAHQGVLGRPLKVGIVSWPGYAGGLVANNGLYRNTDSAFWEKGPLLVDFKVIESSDELEHQFELGGENGGIDVMWSTVDSLAYQLPKFKKKNINIQAFMQVDWSRGGDAIVVGENVRSVADLKGLKVARSLSASQWLLEHTLETDTSLSEEEKKAILGNLGPETGGSTNAREDFKNGTADVAVLWEPDVYDLTRKQETKKPGAHVLIDTSGGLASNLIADVMVTRREFIQDSRGRQAIKAFIRGWIKGTTHANDDPMRAVKMLKEEPRFANRSEEEIRYMLNEVSLTGLDENVQMFALHGGRGTFDDLFEQASAVWLKRKVIDHKVPANEAYDVELLKEVEREFGITKTVGCESSKLTKTLLVDFQGQTTLSDEIKRHLDSEEIAQLLKRYPKARFCVQASGELGTGKDYQLLVDTSRARTAAIVDYLSRHYDRRPSDFIPDVTISDLATTSVQPSAYIRLTVVSREPGSP